MLALRRTKVGAVQSTLGSPLLTELPAALPPAWNLYALEANATAEASEADLGGFVGIDLPSTSSVEITVRAVAPFGSDFDDVARSRSHDEVNQGSVGKVIDPKTGSNRKAKDVDIYGFSISPHGHVKLAAREQLWARFTNLPSSIDGLDPGKPAWIALHALFGGAPSDVVADIRPLFADTRARQVRLKFTALGRHASAFVKRPRIQSGEYVTFDPLPPDQTTRTQEAPDDFTQGIWLPASAPPAVPVAAAQAHPVIAEEVVACDSSFPSVARRRLTEVRLWLSRPWFTSGEGERLGIVLWPRLSRVRGRSMMGVLFGTRTLYERPSLDASAASPRQVDYMTLERFEDRFLTGASRYVTRWGSDPAEAFPSSGWRDWVVPYEVFRDFDFDLAAGTATSQRADVGFVPKAAMPIPETDKQSKPDEDTKADPPANPKRQRYLNVDLLTYEPRFDVDREQWYVDLRLDPGEMVAPFLRLGVVRYQEHAPRDLQVSLPGEPFELQMLTRRQSSVELRPEVADPARIRLEVTVEGPATHDHPVDSTEGADAKVETRMLLRLQGRVRSTGLPRLSSEMEVRAAAQGAKWRGTFVLPRQAVDDPELDLTVHVEERAYRPPTSYPENYFQSNRKEADFMVGSPRYFCSLEVPRPAFAPKPEPKSKPGGS
jgi:hypothetical protein